MYRPTASHIPLKTTIIQEKWDSRIKTHKSTRTATRRQENFESEEVIRSLASATIEVNSDFNFALKTNMAVVVRCPNPVSFEVTRVALMVKPRISRSKNKQLAIF